MMKNKLWALPVNEATLALNEKYPFFYSTHDHCLIISSEQPPSSLEADDKIIKLLSNDEWMWVYAASQQIMEMEAATHTQELETAIKRFADKFLAELERSRDGGTEKPRE